MKQHRTREQLGIVSTRLDDDRIAQAATLVGSSRGMSDSRSVKLRRRIGSGQEAGDARCLDT